MSILRSSISWTDYSGGDGNFVLGCTKISAGCKHCYCIESGKRFGRDYTIVTVNPDKLHSLVKSDFAGENRRPGNDPMVFVCDMSDLFHKDVPDEFVTHAINTLGERTDVTWQILTKRIERAANLLGRRLLPANIWIGATCENQKAVDMRLPYLARIQAAVRFVSVEPMLEPVILPKSGFEWVISGGESGENRRPFLKAWAEDLRSQCEAIGVPSFFKQGTGRMPGSDDFLTGGLRVQDFPVINIVRQPALFEF